MGNTNKKTKRNINTNNTINTNYIIAEINIDEEDINKNIRIINSFENVKNEKGWKDTENDYKFENEKEIEQCKIRIDDQPKKFSYFNQFNKKGKYTITYSFSNDLTNINYIFYECNNLTRIDLSKLNTQNVINMSHMFYGCNSLIVIDLSYLNTQNVTDMNSMFYECNSLKEITKLVSLNTQNVTDMSYILRM